jgi:predicted small secreted protein
MRKYLRFAALAAVLAGAIPLAACNTTDTAAQTAATITAVQQTATQICGYVPAATTVAEIIASFVPGALPVTGIVSQVAGSICQAVAAKSAMRNAGPPQVNGVIIQGHFAK